MNEIIREDEFFFGRDFFKFNLNYIKLWLLINWKRFQKLNCLLRIFKLNKF